MRAADDDPAVVTRRSYDLIAEAYEARNAEPWPEFLEWLREWVAALPRRGGAAAGGAPLPTGGAAAAGAAAGAGGAAGADGAVGAVGAVGGAGAVGAPVVLDVGAGPGHLTAELAGAGARAVALDASAAMVALAARRGVPVVRGDLRRAPFADGAFDGVWSSASLLHVPRAEVPATLAEWRRVTAPGGLLALSTASGGSDGWEDPPYDTRGERPPPRWFTYHDEAPLRALLHAAGWSVESVTTYAGLRLWLRVRARAARG